MIFRDFFLKTYLKVLEENSGSQNILCIREKSNFDKQN